MAGALGVGHAGSEVAHVDAGAEAATCAGQYHHVHVGVGAQIGTGLSELGHHRSR